MTTENAGPMLVEGEHLASDDEGKVKALNAFFLQSLILKIDLGLLIPLSQRTL